MMRQTVLKSNEDAQQEIDQTIDQLLLDFYAIMPSRGTYPFTMIRFSNEEHSDSIVGPAPAPLSQILVLERTDFSLHDLIDYVSQTKEYSGIRSDSKEDFLQDYRFKYQRQAALNIWKNQITDLGIGIFTQLAEQKGLHLMPTEKNLAEPDFFSGFASQGLKIYQLFDCSLIQ